MRIKVTYRRHYSNMVNSNCHNSMVMSLTHLGLSKIHSWTNALYSQTVFRYFSHNICHQQSLFITVYFNADMVEIFLTFSITKINLVECAAWSVVCAL